MKLLRTVYLLGAVGAMVAFAAFWVKSATSATVFGNTVDSIYNEGQRIVTIYVRASVHTHTITHNHTHTQPHTHAYTTTTSRREGVFMAVCRV